MVALKVEQQTAEKDYYNEGWSAIFENSCEHLKAGFSKVTCVILLFIQLTVYSDHLWAT